MSDIEELQRRITAAMDQIAFGIERMGAKPPEADPQTVQQLEDERTANAQLQERVRALRTKSEEQVTDLQARLDDAEGRMAQLDIELQRVRRANSQLVDACADLREANTEGVGEPHLINKAMLAELEGMRAARAADVAEAAMILDSLKPLLDPSDQKAEDA